MNTQKRVFNKLAEETKVELATQKVELAMPNLSQYSLKAQSAYNDGKTTARGVISKAADEMFDARKKISNIIKDFGKQFEKVSQQADDLGVNINDTKVVKNFIEVSKELEDYSISSLELQRKIEKFNI
jgi:hypothetical protein